MPALFDVFARSVRALREAAGLSHGELARRIGNSISYMLLLDLGARGAQLETVEVIAEALEVEPSYLLQESTCRRGHYADVTSG